LQPGHAIRKRGNPLSLLKGYTPNDFRIEDKPAGFGRWIAEGIRNPYGFRMEVEKHRERQKSWGEVTKTVQGMSEGVGSDGGFAVLPEYSLTILEKQYDNNIYDLTDSYPVSGNTMTFPRNAESSRKDGQRSGGMLGYWLGEGASITPSKPTLGQLSLKLKKVAVVVYLTDELIADAGMALEGYINRKASEEFKFLIGNAMFNGKGPSTPLGFMNAGAMLPVAARTGQNPKTIISENIVDMFSRLSPQSMKRAKWFVNQDCLPQLFTMSLGVGTGGVVTFMPPGGLSGNPYATLMGLPVEVTEFSQTLGTNGDISLVDFGEYVTIEKGGVAQAQSIHVEFLTDQLALRFVQRVDGAPWESSPVTPYNGTNTQSSFVTLASR
jgi:HK97 family phage major capsid protein